MKIQYKDLLTESILAKQIITEADETPEDREKFKKQMEWFFPAIWNEIKGSVQMTFPIASTTRLVIAEKNFKKYVNNLDVEIRLNSNTLRNAWTFPFIQGKGEATLVSLTGWFGLLYQLVKATDTIDLHKSKFKNIKIDSNGVVQFPTIPINFLSFITKGLYADLDEREVVAVELHEIGHWVKHEPIVGMMTLAALRPFLSVIPAFAFLLTIMIIINAREAEYEADAFTKECGFAKDQVRALTRITSSIRSNVSFWIKLQDLLNKVFTSVHNVVDKFLPISHHPSLLKRKAALGESYLAEGIIPDQVMQSIQKKCHEIDKMLAPKLHMIFPMK